MAQNFLRQPLRTAPQPFSEAQDPALTSGLFWARLLTYRPLFLLGGLWFTLVCVSAIAYHGLMFNQPLEDTTHRDAPIAVVTSPQSNSSPNSLPNSAMPSEIEPTGAPQSRTVTLWGLFSLVGLCAFGCFVLTQQIKASARPKRKKVRPVAKAPVPARPPQPKRLTPYLPQRDDVVVPGVKVVNAPPQTVMPPQILSPHPTTSPQPARRPQPAPAAFRPVASRGRQRPAPTARTQAGRLPATVAVAQPPSRTPAVVPEGTDLPLDWSEGSVAHALDMRQRRSLSSFM